MDKKFFPVLTGGTLSKKKFFWVKKIFVRKTFDSKYFMIQNSILNTMMRFIWQENNDEMPEIVILWHNFDQKYSHVYALATFLKKFFASKFFLWVSYTLLKLFSTSWRKKSTSKFFWSRGFTIYPSGLNTPNDQYKKYPLKTGPGVTWGIFKKEFYWKFIIFLVSELFLGK